MTTDTLLTPRAALRMLPRFDLLACITTPARFDRLTRTRRGASSEGGRWESTSTGLLVTADGSEQLIRWAALHKAVDGIDGKTRQRLVVLSRQWAEHSATYRLPRHHGCEVGCGPFPEVGPWTFAHYRYALRHQWWERLVYDPHHQERVRLLADIDDALDTALAEPEPETLW